MNSSALLLKGVTKKYQVYASPRDRLREAFDFRRRKFHFEVNALTGIDLEVTRGEVLGVVGKNGAGKSTLLKIIAGLIQPTTGSVVVDGEVSTLLDLGSGMNFERSGRENARFLASLENTEDDLERIVEGIVEFAQIGEMIDRPVKYYSHGMRARVAFAAATSIQPDILIVDEVLAVGDSQFQRRCYARMEALMSQGTTVLFVSHDSQSVVEFCRRAIALQDGVVVDDGKPAAVIQNYLRNLDQKSASIGFSDSVVNCEEQVPKNSSVACLPAAAQDEGHGQVRVEEDATAWLDPELKVKEFLDVRNGGVKLRSLRIMGSSGTEINTFMCGAQITVEVILECEEDLHDVVLPISIKTKKGVEVSGIRYPSDKTAINIKRGTFVACASFRCPFLVGDYFLTVGVTQLLGDGKEVIYRADDCGTYRVIDDGKIVRWGLFDISPIWTVEQVDE